MSRLLVAFAFWLLAAAPATAAAPSAPPPAALLFNSTLWTSVLGEQDWWGALQRDVVAKLGGPDALPAPEALLAPLADYEVALKSRWPVQEARCQLALLSLLGNVLAEAAPQLLAQRCRSRAPPPLAYLLARFSLVDMGLDLERHLLRITAALHRNQTLAAFSLSTHAGLLYGWRWGGAHLAALSGAAPGPLPDCWDEVAVLSVLLDPQADYGEDSTLAQLVHGPLGDSWGQRLFDYFQGSREHYAPRHVHGNLAVLPAPDAARLSLPHSPHRATVQWALPVAIFQDFDDAPSSDNSQHVESGGFVAGGYAWHVGIVVDSPLGNVSLVLRAWEQHAPPEGRAAMVVVNVAVVHAKGGQDLALVWQCPWPAVLAPGAVPQGKTTACAYPAMLPLWGLLSGSLPGFVKRGELLLRVTVEVSRPLALPAGAAEHPAEVCTTYSGGSQAYEAPPVGPLGANPQLLSGPALRWGYGRAASWLWGMLGFPSRRLPGSGGEAADALLVAAREARFGAVPGLEEAFNAAGTRLLVATTQWGAWAAELPLTRYLAAGSALLLAAPPIFMLVLRPAWHAYSQWRARRRLLGRIRRQAQQARAQQEEEEQAATAQAPAPPGAATQRKQGQQQQQRRRRQAASPKQPSPRQQAAPPRQPLPQPAPAAEAGSRKAAGSAGSRAAASIVAAAQALLGGRRSPEAAPAAAPAAAAAAARARPAAPSPVAAPAAPAVGRQQAQRAPRAERVEPAASPTKPAPPALRARSSPPPAEQQEQEQEEQQQLPAELQTAGVGSPSPRPSRSPSPPTPAEQPRPAAAQEPQPAAEPGAPPVAADHAPAHAQHAAASAAPPEALPLLPDLPELCASSRSPSLLPPGQEQPEEQPAPPPWQASPAGSEPAASLPPLPAWLQPPPPAGEQPRDAPLPPPPPPELPHLPEAHELWAASRSSSLALPPPPPPQQQVPQAAGEPPPPPPQPVPSPARGESPMQPPLVLGQPMPAAEQPEVQPGATAIVAAEQLLAMLHQQLQQQRAAAAAAAAAEERQAALQERQPTPPPPQRLPSPAPEALPAPPETPPRLRSQPMPAAAQGQAQPPSLPFWQAIRSISPAAPRAEIPAADQRRQAAAAAAQPLPAESVQAARPAPWQPAAQQRVQQEAGGAAEAHPARRPGSSGAGHAARAPMFVFAEAPAAPPPVRQRRPPQQRGGAAAPFSLSDVASIPAAPQQESTPAAAAWVPPTPPQRQLQHASTLGGPPVTMGSGASTGSPSRPALPSLPAAAAAMLPAAAPAVAPAARAGSAADGGTGFREDSECVICLDARRCAVLVPCGHLALCSGCAEGLMAQPEPLCPLCRTSVTLAQQVFLP